ncbi:hypothetical protein OG429_40875 (plasmid) [Streptomyces sp. NBC_00190]|uniref:hypothetical protein n=1 Tax=unclassified Streptomyces TaxID=2593676 RepID=UPI002E2E60F2|nr:hypothetical protein [Streptomyces sp. NBC_00190]WSZ45689.1 hypothetical protein OG239_43760 [Streptomyces sp. NBC_00868]
MTAAPGQALEGAPRVARALPGAEDRAAANARMIAILSRPDPGPVAEHLALLHFTGRRSGGAHTVPAGVHRLADGLVIATGSAWRHNFAGGADGELTWRGRREPVRFELVTDPERTARGYLELYERYGAEAAHRRLGILVAEDGPAPTLDDFRAAVAGIPLALVAVTATTSDTTELAMNERTSR